jgi:diacylglycerol O-acyltransferase / wax synthase
LVNLKSVLPTDYPSFLAPWIVGGAARLALKTYGRGNVAEKLPMVANLVISNVPGPQVPLYMAGARMLTFHPLSIVMHGLGLNITIQTYAGTVDFGIIAGKNALPHAQDLANALLAAFNEAQSLYAMGQIQAAVVTPTPVKPSVSRATKKQTVASKAMVTKTIAVKAGTLGATSTPVRRKTATAPSSRSPRVKTSHAPIHGKTKTNQRST